MQTKIDHALRCESRSIAVKGNHGTSLTDFSAALGCDPAVVSKHAIRMGVPFGARTVRAPRGPRRNRVPVTLGMLLAMDEAGSGATRQG